MPSRAFLPITHQHLEVTKLTRSLEAKEKKKTDRTILFPGGKGRHLTDPEFIRELEEQDARRELEASEKNERAANRLTNKATRAAAELTWEQIKLDHLAAVAEHKMECQRLRAEGTKVKDLPKAPKRPKNGVGQCHIGSWQRDITLCDRNRDN